MGHYESVKQHSYIFSSPTTTILNILLSSLLKPISSPTSSTLCKNQLTFCSSPLLEASSNAVGTKEHKHAVENKHIKYIHFMKRQLNNIL